MAGAEVPVTNPTTGEIRMVPREGVKAFTEQTGWHVSTAEQREVQAENLESGSTGQQALAAGEQAVRTATLGLAPGMEGWQQRERVLRRQRPGKSGGVQGQRRHTHGAARRGAGDAAARGGKFQYCRTAVQGVLRAAQSSPGGGGACTAAARAACSRRHLTRCSRQCARLHASLR